MNSLFDRADEPPKASPPARSGPPAPPWKRPKESHAMRDYQARAVAHIGDNLAENGSTLLVMATGLGKTVTLAHAIKRHAGGKRAMVIAHRQELIEQNARTIGAVLGEPCDIEMGDRHADLPGMPKARVIVASKDSLHEKRLARFNPAEFGMLVDDEAHHSVAASYRAIHAHFKGVPHLGVTATPDRTDEEALGQVFGSVAMVYDIVAGIGDGWLVPIRAHTPFVTDMTLDEARTVAGDFNQGDLAQIMERDKVLHEVASSVVAECGNRRAIIFTASVRQAELLSEILNDYKPGSARWVSGETDREKRAYDLSEHRAGRFQFVLNCAVLTEGYDDPGCSMIVMARPTKSRSLFAQMIGRGTRTLPGLVDGLATAEERREAIATSAKPNLRVLSYTGNCGRHKLITPADVLGGEYPDEVVQMAAESMRDGEQDVAAALVAAKERRLKEIESSAAMVEYRAELSARAKIVALAKYMLKEEDLFDAAVPMPGRERTWRTGKSPTEKQLDVLEAAGFDRVDCDRLSRVECSRLIGEVIARRARGLATLKQARALERRGYKNAGEMTFAEAGAALNRLYGDRR